MANEKRAANGNPAKFPALNNKPDEKNSGTSGYVISTPLSIATGKSGNIQNPNKAKEAAAAEKLSGRHAAMKRREATHAPMNPPFKQRL
jgi:hypothetical protein